MSHLSDFLDFDALSNPGSNTIPDAWPGAALRNTINESRSFFVGKRVLVTGACGFVGGHLARALHAAGAIVTALDKDISPSRGSQLDLTGLRHELDMVEADITDRAAMAELVKNGGFSHIFHLAAGATTVEKAMTDPVGTIMANTMGFVNLAEGARLLPEAARPVVIYSSTDKVYGEAETLPYTEEHDLGGVGVYDAAKLCADILAGTYHKALGVPTIVLRMCNIFGPYDLNFDYRLIPKAMRNIFRDGESPELYMNSLEHFRDYLFVEDAVRAYFHIARCEGCQGRVYNLPGAHYSATPDVLRDIVSHISDLQDEAALENPDSSLANHHWNRSIRIVPSDPKLITISKQHLDGTRIFNEACFEPQTSFRDGLQATALFYLWYFSQIAPREQLEVETLAPMEAHFESDFNTIYTHDGLPVHVLNPQTTRQETSDTKAEARRENARPHTFLVETSLAA
ncbi:Nucleoside-diphosphate-sugar epimerase [Abditibacterium utsteinense]|uniref:Nucleoside-diphosphate-sugar epimerase n=1 Tax=Abditibacterium utsteinense TaxID=1960156 RepID=A0A2S8SW37_9BACT|nr:NAD-dependent epimerase/dehydratase family protein [Abditibacterium utsteinense]PQV65010.1 Nucleoside-diphosphate-sugar epimerase [Abditibacterium utsteinense]